MANKLKEYNGHHTMKKASPRPFVDDEAELNNYLEKNRYGGEGNHYSKDSAMPNPNRTRFTKFEENLKNSKRNLSLDDKAKLYFMGMMKVGLIDKMPSNPKSDFVQAMMDSELAAILDGERDPRNMDEVEYKVADASDVPSNLKDDDTVTIDPNLNENKMKKSDLLRDYMSSRKGTNLNEQMITHKKDAKRSILMEGAMKKFFELFEIGRTDEEIVLDYASKGVQVPEQFVSKARGQYEGLKKMKLELDMSEKEFKNSAKDIVNNPDEQVVNSEDKPLSSGIYDV